MKPIAFDLRRAALLYAALLALLPVTFSVAASRPGYLGVSVEKMTADDRRELGAEFGVLVVDVAEDSPAEKAGLREDDVIQSFDGKKTRRPQDLVKAVREAKPRTQAKVEFVRDKKKTEVTVEVGRRKSTGVWSFDAAPEKPGRTHAFPWPRGGRLGVTVHGLDADLAEYFKVKADGGALVLEVEEDGPAAEAGIKAGDVIVKIGDEEVADPDDLTGALSETDGGETVEIVILRRGVRQTVKAELEEWNPGRRLRTLRIPDPPEAPQHFNFQFHGPDAGDMDAPNRISIEINDAFCRELERNMERLGEDLERHFNSPEFERQMEELGRNLERDLEPLEHLSVDVNVSI